MIHKNGKELQLFKVRIICNKATHLQIDQSL